MCPRSCEIRKGDNYIHHEAETRASTELSADINPSGGGQPGAGRRWWIGVALFYYSVLVSQRNAFKVFVTVSNTETEYVALLECARTSIWLYHMLQELRLSPGKITVYTGNVGVVKWAAGHLLITLEIASMLIHVITTCMPISKKESSPYQRYTHDMARDIVKKPFHVTEYKLQLQGFRWMIWCARMTIVTMLPS